MIEFDIAPDAFRQHVFEKRVHLQKGAVRDSRVTWSDLDELLDDLEARAPSLRLFKDDCSAVRALEP